MTPAARLSPEQRLSIADIERCVLEAQGYGGICDAFNGHGWCLKCFRSKPEHDGRTALREAFAAALRRCAERSDRMLAALEWLVHLHAGVGKAGGALEAGEWEEAIACGVAALAPLTAPSVFPVDTPPLVKAHAQPVGHRCAGCGHHWEGRSVGPELCGECWRKVRPVLHGEGR